MKSIIYTFSAALCLSLFACDINQENHADASYLDPPSDFTSAMGKADSTLWHTNTPEQRLNIGEPLTMQLEHGLSWASFELSRGQVINLSFEEASSLDVFIYGPITHREDTAPQPNDFIEQNNFINGWRNTENIHLSASSGGHYLLITRTQDTSKNTVMVNSSCAFRCDTREDLGAQLQQLTPHNLRLPERDDLAAIPYDEHNPLNKAKVELGRILFHSPKLGTQSRLPQGRETYSCSTCHNLNHGSGAGAPQGIGEGGVGGVFNQSGWSQRLIDSTYKPEEIDAQPIASPTILNSAYQSTALWNGAMGFGDVIVPGSEPIKNLNADFSAKWVAGTPPYWSKLGFSGLETQAIVGLHVHRQSIQGSSLEHDPTIINLFKQAFSEQELTHLAHYEDCYHVLLKKTFPKTYFSTAQDNATIPEQVDCSQPLDPSPYRDDVVSDLKTSLAIAAYERTLLATHAPFQQWLHHEDKRTSHAMTLDEMRGALVFFDSTRGNCASCHSGPALSDGQFHVMGLADLLESDRNRIHTKLFEGEELGRGGWIKDDSQKFAFKTPQLYNLKQKNFFGHGSTHRSLESMIRYMARGEHMVGFIGNKERLDPAFTTRNLSEPQLLDLITFVQDGLLDQTLSEKLPEPSPDTCIISADETSRQEQGCNPTR